MSKFTATAAALHHLSVGAILTDSAGRIALMNETGVAGMMTGTVEDGESLEACLHRELAEETGATCQITGFAGVTQTTITDQRGVWIKSVVWFRCTLETDPNDAFLWADKLDDFDEVDQGRWPHGL